VPFILHELVIAVEHKTISSICYEQQAYYFCHFFGLCKILHILS